MAIKRGVHGGQRVNWSVPGAVTFCVLSGKMLGQGCLILRYVTQWTLVRCVVRIDNQSQQVLHAFSK